MAKVQHTCTGCVPIDASIIDVYVTLVQTNQFVTDAETGRALAEAARVTAENARKATFSEDHSRAVTDHTNAQTAINNANAAAAAANAAGITSASASVDSNVGTPSVDVSLVNKQLSLSFHNIKGEKGEKGDRGDGAVPVVNDLVTGGTDAALSAEMGKTLNTTKQATLVSGTNIKTVNGESLLGEGNIVAGDPNAVKYVAQTLTDAQKAQARTNIDAYQKPSTGIPATDMASGVQTSLGKADTAYQKPGAGVPKTDLESGVQASLDLADSAIQARPMGAIDPTITPADYATKEELDELEAKASNLFSYPVTLGKGIVAASGNLNTVASRAVTDYISITGYNKIRYTRHDTDSAVQNYGIAFYDSNKGYISGIPGGTNSGIVGYSVQDATIPTDASFVRFTLWADPARGRFFFCDPTRDAKEKEMDSISTRLDSAETNIASAETRLNTLDTIQSIRSSYPVINGKAIQLDGTINNVASRAITDYIDISGYNRLFYTRHDSDNVNSYGIVFFDSNKDVISGVLGGSNSGYVGYSLQEAVIPSGAIYVRFTLWADPGRGRFYFVDPTKDAETKELISLSELKILDKSNAYELAGSFYIDASLGEFKSNTNALVYFFAIPSGSIVKIKSNSSYGASFAFVYPFDTRNTYVGKSVSYTQEHPAQYVLSASEERTMTVNEDCWLYVFQSGTSAVVNRYPSFVSCSRRVSKLELAFPSQDTLHYVGEKPTFTKNPFSRREIATLPSYAGRTGVHQGFAVYNDYIALFTYSDSPASAKIGLFNLPGQTLLATIDLPFSTYKRPHGNAMTFGKTLHSGNSVVPLLYVSQWDADGERGCLVYDITLSGGVYSATLVQAIIPDIDGDIFGNGQADWVVDGDYLYSVAYMLSQNGPYILDDETNPTMVCKFAIPAVTNVVEKVLTVDDTIDHFAGPSLPYRQGVYVNGGRIWMNRGNANTGYSKYLFASALDTISRKVVTEIPLLSFGGEPEGIATYGEKLVMGWSGNAKIYVFDFN